MSVVPEEEYSRQLSAAIGAYQLIEEMLKRRIDMAFKLIKYKLGKEIPFKFSGDDYENSPMERLIAVFEKVSDNEDLIRRLNRVKTDRNYVAHRAFVEYLKGDESAGHHLAEMKELTEKVELAWGCIRDLQSEAARAAEYVAGMANNSLQRRRP